MKRLLGKDFLDRVQKTGSVREIINTIDFIKKF